MKSTAGNTRTALVTGGAGFVGTVLSQHLRDAGWNVRTMGASPLESLGGKTDIRRGDICDLGDCEEYCTNVDTVFHLAASFSPDPVRCQETNVGGTRNLLQAARNAGVRRFVFSSSASVYGNTAIAPVAEDATVAPDSPYARSKFAAEQAVLSFHERGMETIVLRYFNVFGAGQRCDSPYPSVITRFAHALRTRQAPVIHGDGMQTRDFVHVDDVARANLLASEQSDISGRIFNVGSGQGVTLRHLLQRLQQMTGSDVPPVYFPARFGDVRYSIADTNRAQAILHFVPHIPLDEGLRRIFRDC